MIPETESGGRIDRARLAVILSVCAVALAAAFIFLPSGLIRLSLMGLVALPAAFILFDKPEWIFFILIALVFSSIHIFFSLPVVKMVTLLLIISFMVSVLAGRKIAVHDIRFFMLTAAFLIVVFQSMIFARDIGSSLSRIAQYSRYIVFLFFMIQFSRSKEGLTKVLIVIAIASLASNFLPFLLPLPEDHADLSLMWGQGVYRYEGYASEANMFAISQNFLIPILLFLFARFKKPWFMRPLILAFIVGTVFVLILSFSRGGFIGLVVLFVSLMIVERRNRGVMLTCIGIIVAGAILAPAAYWERIGSLVEIGNTMTEDTAILSRLFTMKIAVMLGLSNPLFGIGIENFLFYVTRYVPFANVVHNSILQIFAALGFPGLILISWLMIYNLKVTKRLISGLAGPEGAMLGRMLLVQQLAVFVNSMFLPVAFDLVFWFTLGLPAIAYCAYTGRDISRLRDAVRY